MHIYSDSEFEKKQRDFIRENFLNISENIDFLSGNYTAGAVIKNYVYYPEPVVIY